MLTLQNRYPKKTMEFIRILKDYDHLWAVKQPDKETDELTDLFNRWNNAEYLLNFFMRNYEDLKSYFHIERISDAIADTFDDADALEEMILEFPYTENLDEIFHPLDTTDANEASLSRNKARNWDRERHASWLRVYAIRIEPNIYIVTGGAIKLTRTMQEREHTQRELDKLNCCKNYLKSNGVFDIDSFVELINE